MSKQAELLSEEPEHLPAETKGGAGGRQIVPYQAPKDIRDWIERIMEKNPTPESLEKILDISERMADRSAAQEFADALRSFQEECPPIKRSAVTDYVTKTGVRVHYDYAPLKEIAATVRPILARFGLSFTWDHKVDGGQMDVTCIVKHMNGHRESSTFTIPIESGNRMSASQSTNSAATVGRRQSLISALGLTDTDNDDDGANPDEAISYMAVANLESLIEEVNADRGRFLKHFKIKDLADMRESQYGEAVAMLERKRRQS